VAQLSTLGGYTRSAFFVELVWLAEAFEDSDFDEQVADSSAGFSSRRFRAAGKCGAVSQQAFFAEVFLSYGHFAA